MERELEFIAWNPVKKKMYDGDKLGEFQRRNVIFVNLEYGTLTLGVYPKNNDYYELIPLQSACCCDKNGHKIYKNFIIKVNQSVGKVVFKNSAFLIEWIKNVDCWNDWLWVHASNSEIIGNIYQNPEMMEGR